MGEGDSSAAAVTPFEGIRIPERLDGRMWLAYLSRRKRKENKEKPRTGYYRIYIRSFLDNPLIEKMGEEERDMPFLVL